VSTARTYQQYSGVGRTTRSNPAPAVAMTTATTGSPRNRERRRNEPRSNHYPDRIGQGTQGRSKPLAQHCWHHARSVTRRRLRICKVLLRGAVPTVEMTDDIVTRLRNIASLRGDMSGHVIPLACLEAANEIERLQEQNSVLRTAVGEENRANRMTTLYEASQEDIKRLRWELTHAIYCPRQGCKTCTEIEKEVCHG